MSWYIKNFTWSLLSRCDDEIIPEGSAHIIVDQNNNITSGQILVIANTRIGLQGEKEIRMIKCRGWVGRYGGGLCPSDP